MLITAATGFVTVPVKFEPDSLGASFILADGEYRFLVRTVGNDAYQTLRNVERTGERVFVAGMGTSEFKPHIKKHLFQIHAALVVPAVQVDRPETEKMVSQMMTSSILFGLDGNSRRNGNKQHA